MSDGSKRTVWLFFKVIELVMSVYCCYTHSKSFTDESFPHTFLHCGTFGGATIYCLIAIANLIFAEKPTPQVEGTITIVFGLLYMVTVYVTMHLVEIHKHLIFLDNLEEDKHIFFMCCRRNAVAALYTGAVFLLNGTLAMDLFLNNRPIVPLPGPWTEPGPTRQMDHSIRPLKIYFISKGAEKFLNRYAWFRALSGNIFAKRRESRMTPPNQIEGSDFDLNL